jgi:phage terminase large subunit-like protein
MRRLRHTKGKWAGQPLIPDPWQVAHIIAPIFGWVRKDSAGDWVRIITSAHVDVSRRQGKSTIAGGIAIYLTAADGESGAEVYALAASKDQARRLFDPVKMIAERSPDLAPHVKCLSDKIVHKRSLGSFFQVVSSIADLMHGANVHGGIVDELHVHKDPALLETVETGTGSRSQPLVVTITTTDKGQPDTIYDRRRRYVEQLAERVFVDESTYGVIWAADDEDQYGERPFLEETWKKANPGYGCSPTREYLERAAKKAKNSPADLNTFLQLHLGIRARQATRYFELSTWDANGGLVDEQALLGREAYGGLDLASTSDLCAFVLLFPRDEAGGYDVLWRFWMPEAALEALNKRTAGAASVWVREGFLRLTPGNVTDYDHIKAAINTDRERYDIKRIGYDRWNASQIVNDLVGDGAPMEPLGQGFASMSAPTKELQRVLLQGAEGKGGFATGGNPCARWQASNFAVAQDAAGNVKPAKDKAMDKIDGIVAQVIALDGAMRREVKRKSAYDDHDLEVV